MFKHLITGISFILLVICSNHLYAQQKYEKESRLKEKEIPPRALGFIDSLEVQKKVRWYLEEGFGRSSIEAKFKLNKQKYSIEFDTIGNLDDIEIQITWNELPAPLKESISFHLGKDCRKFNIRKVQIQYSGDRSVLFSVIKKDDKKEMYIVNYEIVVKCSNTQNVALFEYLFSNTGQPLTVSQIIFKNSSNLEY